MKKKLEERKAVIEKEFSECEAALKALSEQRAAVDKRFSEIQVRMRQLQGSFAEVKQLLDECPKDPPELSVVPQEA